MLGWRDGSRTDIREPRRSWPWSSLLSRSSDTFIRRGFGVLKMVRLSRQRALLNSRRTTQMMMNMTAMATSTAIMVGSTYRSVTMGRFTVPRHSTVPSGLKMGFISNRQMQRPSRHSVCSVICSHCSVKKQLSFT
uniref:(northern house mosquito) hypothetical protein n=1 Tax=Culex pipiens TaxID=7175 RepID=A0A8D8GUI8_CULPI